MAQQKGVDLLIKLGDGADPEVFTEPCGLTTRSFNREASANDSEIYNCAAPNQPSWVSRIVSTISSNVEGSGKLQSTSVDAWDNFFTSGQAKNLEITVPGLGVFVGPYILTSLNFSGEHKADIDIDITLQSAGEIAKQP